MRTYFWPILRLWMLAFTITGFHARATAQQIEDPVSWSYGVKKLAAGQYNLYFRAKIKSGWHIYAGKQPENAIAVPTQLIFSKSDFLHLTSQAKEVGKKEIQRVEELEIIQYYYAERVDFIQTVIVSKKPEKITGKIIYMACNDQMCLPEKELQFSIKLPD